MQSFSPSPPQEVQRFSMRPRPLQEEQVRVVFEFDGVDGLLVGLAVAVGTGSSSSTVYEEFIFSPQSNTSNWSST